MQPWVILIRSPVLQPWLKISKPKQMGLCLNDEHLFGCVGDVQTASHETVETFSFGAPFDAACKSAISAYIVKNQLETTPATLILDSKKCQYFLIDNIDTEEKYKKEAIQWGLTDFLDYPAEDAVIEYMELPTKNTMQDKKMIYAFAVHKEIIAHYQSWAADCKINITKIDIWQNTIKHLLCEQDALAGVMMIVLRPDMVEIVILRNKEIYLLRQLDISVAKYKFLQEKKDTGDFYNDLCVEIHRTIDFCASKIMQPNVSQILLYDDMSLDIDFLKVEEILGIKIKSILTNENIQKKNMEAKFVFAYGAMSGVLL